MVTANKFEDKNIKREFDRLYQIINKLEDKIEAVKAQAERIQKLVDQLEVNKGNSTQ